MTNSTSPGEARNRTGNVKIRSSVEMLRRRRKEIGKGKVYKKNERMLAREQIAIQTEMRENRKSFVSHKKVLIKVKTGLDELRLRTSHYTRRHSWWTPNTRKLSQRSFSLFDFFFFFFNLMENFNFQNIVRLLNLSTNVTFIPKRQLNSIVLMKGCWDYE